MEYYEAYYFLLYKACWVYVLEIKILMIVLEEFTEVIK